MVGQPNEPFYIYLFNFIKLISNGLTFQNISNLSSIAAFILTILIFIKIKRIHSSYILKIRGPIIINKLKTYLSNISKYLNDFDSFKNDLNRDLTLCKANLKSLEGKVPRKFKKTLHTLLIKIDKYIVDSPKNQKESVNFVYNDIQAFVEEFINLREDLDWREKL